MLVLDSPAVLDTPQHSIDISAAVESVYARSFTTAVERGQAGGHTHAEREAIRASGLLGLRIPQAFDGLG